MDKICTRIVYMDRLSKLPVAAKLISHTVLMQSFGKSPFPHKFVNSFFVPVMIKDKLTNFGGN